MKTQIKRASVIILLISVSLAVLNCKNPFTQIGLGDKVDLEVPDLAVTSHGNGAYVGGTIDLAGTYADDIDVASIRISIASGAFAEATINPDNTWSFAIDTTTYTDGEKELVILVEDSSAKVIEKRLLLFFDNKPPLVLVSVPFNYDPANNAFNGVFSIKGDAYDAFGIQEVVVELRDTTLPANTIVATAAGTNSWSATFDSTSLAPPNGDFYVIVTAKDKSDNANSYVFHSYDIYDWYDTNHPGNIETVTVEQLYSMDQGVDEGLLLQPADLPALQKLPPPSGSEMIVKIDQAEDDPKFVISNPDENSSPAENIIGASANAIGIVEDDDGVNPSTIEISIDGGAWSAPTQIIPSSGFPLSVRWQYDLPVLTEGLHDIQVQAQDMYGKSSSSPLVGFTIDLGAPAVAVDSPDQGSYHSSDFLVAGTASDPQGVTEVKVSTDGGSNYFDANGLTNWDYLVTVPGDGSWDGNQTIKVLAKDGSGKTAFTNLQVVIDTEDPIVSFLTPGNSTTVNGEVLLKGVSSDNAQVSKVELKIGKVDPWIEMSGTYSWEYTIDSVSYANGTHSDETPPASGVWKLNIQARSTDVAGNATVLSNYNLFIDNDMDKPTVNIVSPADLQNIGGSVLVNGTAFDDDAVLKVQMKLDLDNDGLFTNQYHLNGDPDYDDQFEKETEWYDVSGITTWTQELNTAGELYQTEGVNDGWITMRVRAVDINTVEGNYQEIKIHFDDTIPRFENISHASGDYVKQTFNLTADVLDDVEVADIYISYDGGVNYDDVLNDPSYSGMFSVIAGGYDIDIPIDTSATSSGILYLRLKVVDNANFQKLNYINLNVDNVYPTGVYTVDSTDIYGDDVFSRVQGTAEDTGSVSGIEEIHVYFVRGANVYNPLTGATSAWVLNDFDDGEGDVPYTTDPSYKILIDNRYELGNDGGGFGDLDGHDESLTVGGSTYNWWAEFDSTQISDGTIDIHYVVFDNAGNGHHYLQPGFIKNHKPSITSKTVGSDVDISDSVEGDEQFLYAGSFNARNKMYIEINAVDDDPPGLSYEVIHNPGGFDTTVFSVASGEFFITASPEYDDGLTDFLCRVTDSDGIVVEETIWATIGNEDTVDPTITIEALADGDAPAGHIELSGDSLFDGPPDADVSGTIVLHGTASDNQRMQSIQVTIANFDAGNGPGNPHTVATWSGGQLDDSGDANFTIIDPELSEAVGHQIDWTYSWDTSGVTNSAAKNISVEFKVTDFASPVRTVTDTKSYDVVPYIAGVSTQTGGIKDGNIRAVSGNYSIRQNLVDNTDLITLTGYNLQPITGGVRVSSDADGLVGTTLQGTSLTVDSSGIPWEVLVVRKDSDRSGYLTVVSGTAGDPIPSLNNINDNSKSYNQEPDIYSKNDLLTDDRYLRLFGVTETGYDNGYYPAMIMNGDNPEFGYCEDNSGEVRRNATTMGRGWYHRMSALTRDGAGNYYQVSVHDAFGSGNNGHLNIFYNNYGGNIYPNTSQSIQDFNNAIALDNITFGSTKLNRFHYPRLIAVGNDTKAQVYLSYYDDEPSIQDLIIRVFQIGTTCDGTELTNLAAGVDSNQDEANGDGTAPGRNTVAGSASKHFDMGLTSGGDLIVAYYDETANRLKVTYNEDPVNVGTGLYGGSFPIHTSMDTTYNGAYVSLAVDAADHIHIAYYDSASADLKYIYLDSYNDSAPDIARVDSYHSVGLWTDIQVDSSGVPYIAYYNNSENGTVDSIKLAYFLGSLPTVTDGVDGSGNITGNWECLTVPVTGVPRGGLPQFNRVSLGFDASGDPLLGYLADDIEYSRMLPELP